MANAMIPNEAAASARRTLFATGFVADRPDEGTTFPSAGGNSSDPRIQGVYWRCIVNLFASARYTNPEQRLALFSNAVPPVVDGVDIGAVLERFGVEIHQVPLTARLAPGTTKSWGNVLYFHDIMAWLVEHEEPDLRLALVDSDVLVTRPLAPLFSMLDEHPFGGYIVRQTEPDEVVNGLTVRDMDRLSREFGATGGELALHFGGELFLTSIAGWLEHRGLFDALLHDALTGTGIARSIITEEHIFSIAFAVLDGKIASANHLIKRIWTSPRYNSVAPGDERLLLWHLPAEKRYGLRDIFDTLRRQGFPEAMDPAAFRAMAMAFCGLPRKSPRKILHDGMRQLAARLGLYP